MRGAVRPERDHHADQGPHHQQGGLELGPDDHRGAWHLHDVLSDVRRLARRALLQRTRQRGRRQPEEDVDFLPRRRRVTYCTGGLEKGARQKSARGVWLCQWQCATRHEPRRPGCRPWAGRRRAAQIIIYHNFPVFTLKWRSECSLGSICLLRKFHFFRGGAGGGGGGTRRSPTRDAESRQWAVSSAVPDARRSRPRGQARPTPQPTPCERRGSAPRTQTRAKRGRGARTAPHMARLT